MCPGQRGSLDHHSLAQRTPARNQFPSPSDAADVAEQQVACSHA